MFMSPPSRRAVLRWGAALGTAGLSGCSSVFGEDNPLRSDGPDYSYDCETGRTRYEGDAAVPSEATWPMLQYDAGHTSYNPDATIPEEVDLRWRYTACTEVDGIVTVANQHVYPGQLMVDAQTGAPTTGQWTGYQKPAIGNETLCVGGHDLHAYDTADMSHQWTFKPTGKFGGVSAPVVYDGLVYIAGNLDDPTLYAVDVTDGSERWQFTPSNEYNSPPAIADGYVYVVDEGGVLYKLAATTGEERWRRDTEVDTLSGVLTVADETVYLPGDDGTVVALDTADGQKRWRWHTDNSRCFVAVADDTVFVTGNKGCVALREEDGTKRWETTSVTGAACSVAANALVVGGDEKLHALSRDDGTGLWSFKTRSVLFYDYTASGISTAPALVDDVVLAATQASDLYALGPT
mgnify:CR=1 FL=1